MFKISWAHYFTQETTLSLFLYNNLWANKNSERCGEGNVCLSNWTCGGGELKCDIAGVLKFLEKFTPGNTRVPGLKKRIGIPIHDGTDQGHCTNVKK